MINQKLSSTAVREVEAAAGDKSGAPFLRWLLRSRRKKTQPQQSKPHHPSLALSPTADRASISGNTRKASVHGTVELSRLNGWEAVRMPSGDQSTDVRVERFSVIYFINC